MAYWARKRYLLRGVVGAFLGAALGYWHGTPNHRVILTGSIAVVGLLDGLVLGFLFDVIFTDPFA